MLTIKEKHVFQKIFHILGFAFAGGALLVLYFEGGIDLDQISSMLFAGLMLLSAVFFVLCHEVGQAIKKESDTGE